MFSMFKFSHRGGGHSGPARLHNFPRLKNLTLAPRHLGRSSQRQNCGKTPYSVHQWIGNWILPHFDPKMSSLGLLEAKIIPKLRIMGIIVMSVIFVVLAVDLWFPSFSKSGCGGVGSSHLVFICVYVWYLVLKVWILKCSHIAKVCFIAGETSAWVFFLLSSVNWFIQYCTVQ